MKDITWTLERELCEISNRVSLEEALVALRLLHDFQLPFTLTHETHWIQRGSETYSYVFWVSENGEAESGYIMKAPINITVSPDETLSVWMRRRELLESVGIVAPKLIYSGKGILIEELLPMSARQAVRHCDKDQLLSLLVRLAHFAGRLNMLNFAPKNIFSDLMSHGDDIVLVDFGEDLGAPNSNMSDSGQLFEELLAIISLWIGPKLDGSKKRQLKEHFDIASSMRM